MYSSVKIFLPADQNFPGKNFQTNIGGFHVTSSPPCWWTVNKRLLISSFCLSTSICSFHHCYLCLPRLHENHLYGKSKAIHWRNLRTTAAPQTIVSRILCCEALVYSSYFLQNSPFTKIIRH